MEYREVCRCRENCFFKQKTAYEIEYGLVGSEMCIRDSAGTFRGVRPHWKGSAGRRRVARTRRLPRPRPRWSCLLYTSDAADDLLCVDLGGRRIIKKKIETIGLYNYLIITKFHLDLNLSL